MAKPIAVLVRPSGDLELIEAADVLSYFSSARVDIMHRDDGVAVAWFETDQPKGVNETATALMRHYGHLPPSRSVYGTVVFTGPDEKGIITSPPAWTSEAIYRLATRHREWLHPKPGRA